jgi:hypothetical protein
MAVLVVELAFPNAPITSLQKRIEKGIEQLYYAKLFVTSPTYEGPGIWRNWIDHGFHVATFSPPPGTERADRVRVRLKAPSPTPVVSVEGANTDALKDLESLVRLVDAARGAGSSLRDGELGRALVIPVVETLQGHGFDSSEVDAFVAMLQRGYDALTDEGITGIDVRLS